MKSTYLPCQDAKTPWSRSRRHEKRGPRVLVVGAAFAALLAAGLLGLPASASATTRALCTGRIAFDSVRDGNRDIYMINAPGICDEAPAGVVPEPPVRLTTSSAPDAKPAWSPQAPDGTPRATLVAFERTSGGNTDIYRLDLASPEPSGEVVRITRDAAADTAPAWAQDTLTSTFGGPVEPRFAYPPIAFARELNGKRDIFVANYDGSDETNVTNTPAADEGNPDWSPAGIAWRRESGGDRVAALSFDSDQDGTRQVFVMELRYDEGARRYEAMRIAKATGEQPVSFNPSWFVFTDCPPPGGGGGCPVNALVDVIAFAGPDPDELDNEIHYVQSLRGAPFSQTETHTLTTGAGQDSAPAWSTNGTRLAYQSDRDGNSEIYVMDPFSDTESDLNLTRFVGDDQNPDWQPGQWKLDETFPIRPRGRRSRSRSRSSTTSSTTEPTRPGPPSAVPPRLPRSNASRCTKTGSPRNDVLHGTSKRDVICGKGGNDRIVGRGGNDRLFGGPGNDRIEGGAGNDRIFGEAGNDRLNGGRGRDTVSGGAGRDRITARDRQRDRIFGGAGRDRASVDRRGDRVRGVEKLRRGRSR